MSDLLQRVTEIARAAHLDSPEWGEGRTVAKVGDAVPVHIATRYRVTICLPVWPWSADPDRPGADELADLGVTQAEDA